MFICINIYVCFLFLQITISNLAQMMKKMPAFRKQMTEVCSKTYVGITELTSKLCAHLKCEIKAEFSPGSYCKGYAILILWSGVAPLQPVITLG